MKDKTIKILNKFFYLGFFSIAITLGLFTNNLFLVSVSSLCFIVEISILINLYNYNLIIYRGSGLFLIIIGLLILNFFEKPNQRVVSSVFETGMLFFLYRYLTNIKKLNYIKKFLNSKFLNIRLQEDDILSINYSDKKVLHVYRVNKEDSPLLFIKYKDKLFNPADYLGYCKLNKLNEEKVTSSDLDIINIINY